MHCERFGTFIQACYFALAIATAQASSLSIPISSVNKDMLGKEVILQGKVAAYLPPTSQKAPHSLVLRDNTGEIRVAIWDNVWQQIAFKDQLRQGAGIAARVEISEFKGKLEGHVNRPDFVTQSSDGSGLANTPGALGSGTGQKLVVPNVDAITWRSDVAAAQKEGAAAKRRILVFFDNPASENSTFYKEQVFADPRIRAAIKERYIPVVLNLREQAQLAARLGVFRGGTIVIYETTGQAVKKLDSVRNSDELLNNL